MALLQIHELHEVRDRVLLLVKRLETLLPRELPVFRPHLEKTIQKLNESLKQAAIPERYRVAIVGRFKVGKSSFVNALLNEQLAGVNSQPETAAISVLRYSEQFRAEVELVSKEDWEQLEKQYKANAQDPALKRYERFILFNEKTPRKDKDGKEVVRESHDLDSLVAEWVQPAGRKFCIDIASGSSKDERRLFNNRIRDFTSSQKPLHLLVNKLTIYAPVPFLRDNIELIDTPGLDDTERFRVFLTEELVRDVDAILFLTTSGAAYGQGDKEFILRQLRRKQIKHLQIVVTKSDETFENSVRDADENGDTPPSFAEFTKRELARVRSEAQETLNELLKTNELSDDDGFYFMQQLDDVPIHLVSKRYHAEGDIERGGIERVKETLFSMLSHSNRFESSYAVLDRALTSTLGTLSRSFEERLSTLEAHFDPQKVKNEIESIRTLLSKKVDAYAKQSENAIEYLRKDQDTFFKLAPTSYDYIAMLGKEVLSDLERSDLARHWKTRRNQGWGSLYDLQIQVADRIFPKVESLLNTLREQFGKFLISERERLMGLQQDIEAVESSQDISGLPKMELSEYAINEDILGLLQASMDEERNSIVSNLEDFVSEEVYARLIASRNEVSNIFGVGTTNRQNTEVSKFYAEIRTLLGEALRDHVKQRFENFGKAIIAASESIAPQARESIARLIESRITAIGSALEVESHDERDKVAGFLTEALSLVTRFAADPIPLEERGEVEPVSRQTDSEVSSSVTNVKKNDGLSERHYEIEEDAVGFTYERIFRPYIDDAIHICVEDPYIILPFQVDNFARFCALAVRLGKAKSIELISGEKSDSNNVDDADSRLETLRRDLLKRGVDLRFSRSRTIHDREVRFDNGWTVKIGRGLDIYKKPENWQTVEAHDFALRPCRHTKVDVYRSESSSPS